FLRSHCALYCVVRLYCCIHRAFVCCVFSVACDSCCDWLQPFVSYWIPPVDLWISHLYQNHLSNPQCSLWNVVIVSVLVIRSHLVSSIFVARSVMMHQ